MADYEHIVNCKIVAPKDINGNSRKAWLLVRLKAPITTVFVQDDGSGDSQLDRYNCSPIPYVQVRVPLKEFNAWKRST